MKYPKNVHVSISLDQIRDAVMPIKEDADVAARMQIPVTQLRILSQRLRAREYALDCSIRRIGIIRSDVLEDILEPAELRLSRLSAP